MRPVCVLFYLAMLIGATPVIAQIGSPDEPLAGDVYVRYYEPSTFSYQELVALGEQEPLPNSLAQKLKTLQTTPFICNEAYYAGVRPRQLGIARLGPSLRVVTWNIERGLQLDVIKTLLTDKATFMNYVAQHPVKKQLLTQIGEQVDVLQSADVLLLNEVDWGMKRTGYRAVIKELGQALNMNWAYGVEFLEVDPKVLGTESLKDVKDPKERQELEEAFRVDRAKLRALHGTAILSRYPIRDATLRPFEHRGYDWYKTEKAYSSLEKGKRLGESAVLGEKILREIRRGGRTTLIATLDVSDLPEGRLTIAATHLENRTKPKSRQKQMSELLAFLAPIHNPVLIAGDLNTTGNDGSNTSMKKEVIKRAGSSRFWVMTAVKSASGVGLGFDVLNFGYTSLKLQSDPTARGISMLAPNPERGLFEDLRRFKFKDGTAIDFRGDKERTSNERDGTLANSNERAGKGFVTTFHPPRTLGAKGKFRLDWILVKAYAKPNAGDRSYKFAPHFGRVMNEVNDSLEESLSDHAPISVDLPFQEPTELKEQKH